MYGKVTELKKLTRLLESIGQVKDFPVVRNEAYRLNHFAYSWKIDPAEARKGIVQHLEQLPGLLNDLKDRSRREDKKEAYELLISTIAMDEIGFFTLIEVWKNWDRSKAVIYSLAEYFIYWGGVVRRATIFTNPASDPCRSKAIDRLEAKAVEILPKPRVTPEDYEGLLKELETVVREWRETDITPEDRELDHILLDAEAWITELYVLSLLDS